MGVHLQATCEQLEGKKKKNKEAIRNPKISTCSSVAQTKKIHEHLQVISDFKNPDLPYGGPMEPRYHIPFGD